MARNPFRHISLSAVILATALSCGKEEPVPVPASQTPSTLYRYSFDLQEDRGKATLDNNGAFWEEGDMVGLYLGGIGNTEAEINMDTSPKTVILRSATPIPAGTNAYAYYPFDEDNTDASAIRFNIPHIQSGGSVSAMPMAGVPFTIEEGGSTSTNGQIYFMNLASIIDFKVYSSSFNGETVQSVTFQSYGTTISGDAVLNMTSLDPDNEQTLALNFNGSNSHDNITVRQIAPVAASKDAATSIYMVIAPGTYASGTITIVTDAATYTFPFSDKSLARNELKHYTMNLNNATRQAVSEINTFPYSEAFTANKGAFVIEGGTGNEWKFVSTYGAKASGYYSGNGHDVTTSLVSPWVDLTSIQGATLTFEHAYNGYLNTTTDAVVYVISEGDVSWTKLDVEFADSPASQSGYSEFKTVEKDISAYIGHKIRIKFEYKSTRSVAGTWEIRNFVIDSYIPKQVYSLFGDTITDGDYIICYNGKALKNTVTSSRLDYTEITPANNQIENPDASIVWHIAKNGDYWTVFNAAVNKYVASTGADNKAQLLGSIEDKSLWTVSGTSSYEFVNKYNSSNGKNAYLRNNGTYGFACYNPDNIGGALTLYKLGYNSGAGSGGLTPPSSNLPGHLGCFEIPSVGTVSGYAYGAEAVGTTNWYRWNTANSKQKIVTHTFLNTTVSPNRAMRSYTLLQDYDKKCALWVACAMNNDMYPQAVSRKEKWCYDPALANDWQPNLTSSYPDKGGYSYDRGHQLAASYRETTEDQVKMTCYFTNMTPQLSGLNQGRWQSTVETNIRALGDATKGRDTLYVVSGPLFRGTFGTVEDKDGMPCARPTHYFQCFMKVSFNSNGAVTGAKGAAYLVEHVASPTVQYVTIDYVESLTDNGKGSPFDFFANVPESIQNAAEATATPLSDFSTKSNINSVSDQNWGTL